MLTHKGKLYGDLTVACLNENKFMLFGNNQYEENDFLEWFISE